MQKKEEIDINLRERRTCSSLVRSLHQTKKTQQQHQAFCDSFHINNVHWIVCATPNQQRNFVFVIIFISLFSKRVHAFINNEFDCWINKKWITLATKQKQTRREKVFATATVD